MVHRTSEGGHARGGLRLHRDEVDDLRRDRGRGDGGGRSVADEVLGIARRGHERPDAKGRRQRQGPADGLGLADGAGRQAAHGGAQRLGPHEQADGDPHGRRVAIAIEAAAR